MVILSRERGVFMIKFKIKDLRLKKGISQSELGKMINVHQVQINRWENGSRIPKVEKLCDIANALDVTLNDLVEYHEAQDKISEEYIKIMNEEKESD